MGYESFGLRESPFFTDALLPDQESLHKFVGRTMEIKTFLTTMAIKGGCNHIVTGRRGVGKTSFINVMQYICMDSDPIQNYPITGGLSDCPKSMMPCYEKLQVSPTETIESLLFRTVTTLLLSVRKYAANTGKQVAPFLEQIDNEYNKIIIENHTGNLNPAKVCETIKAVVKTIKDFYRREGVFLVIDNLDILDIQFLVDLLNQARMYLLEIEDLYIVLTGSEGLFAAISTAKDGSRITDALRGTETALSDFTESQVAVILKYRVRYGEIEEGTGVLPLDEKSIIEIYKNCNGQIRLLFSVCDEVVLRAQIEYPNIKTKIPENLVQKYLKEIVIHQSGWETLSRKDKQILKKTLDKGSVRSKDYKELGLDRHVYVKNTMERLIKSGHIYRTQGIPGEARAVLYKVTGKVTLAKYSGLFEEIEK